MPQTFTTRFAEQADNVLRAILDQSVECIKLINRSGEIEYINPNGLAALGIDAFETVALRDWASLWPEESQARVRIAVDRALRGQRDRFEGYCPTVTGDPRWWDVSIAPIFDSKGELTHVLATSRDVTQQVQEQLSERRQRLEAERSAERSENVAREMRHRLKNQLAVVASIAKLVGRHSSDVPDMTARLEHKLQALARAQDLLTVHRDRPPTAIDAITQVLDASGAGELIEVGRLPHAYLGDDAIQQLALILGELQTNSLKHGALRNTGDSNDQGRITLTGAIRDKVLSFQWHEDCGSDIGPVGPDGVGLKLMMRLGSVPGQMAKIDWHRRGPAIQFHVRTL